MLQAYWGRREETISSRGGGRGWKCNRSRESSKSKVISSVPLFLYLLSPFYGSPRSFFLPDRDSGQVHCLCSRQCLFLSFPFHFLVVTLLWARPLSTPLSLFLSLSRSLFRGTPLNLRSLLCKRALHHRRQFHSWLPLYVSPGELLCQCQWHRYLSERKTTSTFVVRVRFAEPNSLPLDHPMSQSGYIVSGIASTSLDALRLLSCTRWTSLRHKYERCTVPMYVWPAGRRANGIG